MTEASQEVTFHAKDGFEFRRIVGGEHHGSVKVHVIKDGAVIWGSMFKPAEWASVVATMTCLGETGATFTMFEALQKG